MNPRVRLSIWVVVVLGAIGAPLWLPLADIGSALALGQGVVSLGATLWLLRTTPDDAILVPAWLSTMALPVGVYCQAVLARGAGPSLQMSSLYALVLAFGGAWVLEFPDSVWKRPPETAGSRIVSSWWLALVAWHPALWIAPAGAHTDVRTGALGLALLAALVPSGLAPRLGVWCWVGSGALMTLML